LWSINIFPNLFLNISLAIKASKSSNCILEREREREMNISFEFKNNMINKLTCDVCQEMSTIKYSTYLAYLVCHKLVTCDLNK